VLRDLGGNLLRLIFEEGRLADMPATVSFAPMRDGELTLPSAHSIISSIGSRARYIDVVFHHIGRPNSIMIAQKDRKTENRNRACSGFSGGGSFFVGAAITAFVGGSASLNRGSFSIGTSSVVDMSLLLAFPK
jgi:hypothetical protein